MQKSWMGFTLALALAGNAVGVWAQDVKVRRTGPPPPIERDVIIERHGPDMPPPPGEAVEVHGDNFVFLATEMSFNGKVVKGAPYSAQAVTESVQTLADGNRIVRKNTAQVYRDSEGRTRRDQSLGSIGPYAAQGDPPQTFFIYDPVAGANYILDPRSKTARKLPRMEFRFKSEGKGGADKEIIERSLSRAEGESPRVRMKKESGDAEGFAFTIQTPPPGEPHAGADVQFFRHSSKAETKTEKLEARNVEGVQAEGSRTTTTIPAGELGNEQPIHIVNERWYSPDLQVIVMTRHSDPRFGETTYKLTNIQRGEPSAALFQVPSDYTLKESRGVGAGGPRRMRRPAPPPQEEN